METKQCSKCGVFKSQTDFYKAKNNYDNLQSFCKECDHQRKRQQYARKQQGLVKQSPIESKKLREQGLAKCPHCKETKSLQQEFSQNIQSHTGFASHCKICCKIIAKERPPEEKHRYYMNDREKIRDRKLRHSFGISLKEYQELLKQQGGVCAVCGGTDKEKNLAVDHDHKTGRIRGLLCGRCNPALGFCQDSPEILKKLIDYLNQTKE